jgi:hypothetical protein
MGHPADRENSSSRAWLCNEPSKWGGRRETPSLIHEGWKARDFPELGKVFFLTSPFIELIGTWPTCRIVVDEKEGSHLSMAENPEQYTATRWIRAPECGKASGSTIHR